MKPPKYALKFLRWFCRPDYLEEIEGDIIQLFQERSRVNPKKARWLFYQDVMTSLRWTNVKPLKVGSDMVLYRNYFKAGMRRLIIDRSFTLISLCGLVLGLVVFTTIVLYLLHEFSFDRFHARSDRTYEVIQEFRNPDGADPEIFTSLNLSGALRREVPIVESAVTVHGAASTWVVAGGERYFEEDGIVAGREFFDVFDFQLEVGNPGTALAGKRSIVIDRNLATKYFGGGDPIGEVIELDRYGLFTVTGILSAVPRNSTLQFNYIITQDYDKFLSTVSPRFQEMFRSWEGAAATTFVVLKDKKDAHLFPDYANALLKKNMEAESINPHYLMPLTDLHFGSKGIDGQVNRYVKGDKRQVMIFSIVAALILIMACANHVNLATARAICRTKEVGVRKTLGARRMQLSMQFLVESLLIVLISFVLTLIILPFVLPWVNLILDVSLALDKAALLLFTPFVVLIIVMVTLLSGSYPAAVLSGMDAIMAIKGSAIQERKAGMRKVLVTFQMAMVIGVLIVLSVVNQQFDFMTSKNLGFDTEGLLVVEINGAGTRNNFEKIKYELESNSHIERVTGITRMISGYRSAVSITAENPDNPRQLMPVRFYGLDSDGLRTLRLNLTSGRDFTGVPTQDSLSVILNQTAASYFGGGGIVGQWITLHRGDYDFRAQVIGVVEDFHYSSLHDAIGPVVMGYYRNPFQGLDDIVIRIKSSERDQTIAYVEQVHNQFDENGVMTWEFLDDMKMREYQDELRMQRAFRAGSGCAIIIAMLGIIGLLIYTVNSRIKEFGIRRVLGAKFKHIVWILSQSLLPNLMVAFVLIVPIVWILMNNWLDQFAFRVSPGPWIFLMVIFSVIAVMSVVIAIVSGRAVATNPINSLRYE
ncbi:MAG: ABC transporter permease [Marinoscillum sp.]